MKRSTLTLSILTALLVSACGGSSSNDEQTKDPTPPKVTPTHPTTPSTGRTPTTGKTEQPKKEEASSSSSSDSTPPISSGSAPSGGKPIVIAGEPKKEIKPDPKPNEGKGKEKTDEEKKGDQESADLAAAKEKADKSAEALKLAKQNTVAKTAVANDADEKLKAILAKIKEIHGQFDPDGLPEKALTAADTLAATDADNAKKIRDLYDQYVKDKADAESLRADAENATKAEEEAAAEAAKDAEDVALKQVDEKWKDKPDVQSVKDVVAAEKANAKAQNKKKSLEDKSKQLGDRKTALGDENTADTEIKKAKDDLQALNDLLESATTPETKEKIKTAIKKKTEELKAKKEEAADVANELGHVEADKTTATATATETGKDLENKAKIAKNFGVAGKTGLTDSVFTGVQKAEKPNGGTEWKITFAGDKEGTVVNPNTLTGEVAGNAADYGYFGLIDGKNAAYKASTNSIYGYFGDKFYSAGEATDPKVLAKITPDKIGDFSGHSLLQKPDGSYLVSNVVGKIHFDDSKEFRGNFNSFKAVKGATVSDIEEGRLAKGKSVSFTAIVDKNTFKPATKTDAKVYGYFYGADGKEAGGLVEFENEFHGSFGGAVEIK